MNLRNKKKLIARVLGVGADRVKLISVEEIKEAITRQDILDLKKRGLIKIKEKKGKKRGKKRKARKREGSRKKTIKHDDYVKITRKLRGYIKNLKNKGRITTEVYYDLRKKIRARKFRSLNHLKQEVMNLE